MSQLNCVPLVKTCLQTRKKQAIVINNNLFLKKKQLYIKNIVLKVLVFVELGPHPGRVLCPGRVAHTDDCLVGADTVLAERGWLWSLYEPVSEAVPGSLVESVPT